MNTQGLKKKLGPLPVWAWVLIAGGAVGLLWIFASRSSSTGSSTTTADSQVDPNNPLGLTYSQEQQYEAEGIDPNTGVPYSEEQQSALPGTGGVKSKNVAPGKGLYQEINDILLGEKELDKLKKVAPRRKAKARIIAVKKDSPFARYYHRVTGKRPPRNISTDNWIYRAFEDHVPVGHLKHHRNGSGNLGHLAGRRPPLRRAKTFSYTGL